MNPQPMDAIPIWLLFVAVCALSGLVLEGGYRLGRWRHRQTAEEKETPVGCGELNDCGIVLPIATPTVGSAPLQQLSKYFPSQP